MVTAEMMGSAGVDPNWTAEEWFLVLKQALEERDDARELAAMYLQCLNSRAMERGETVEQVAAFCKQEFAENPWLREEYEKLANTEASVKAFLKSAGFAECLQGTGSG
jgi:hypothetical protein